VKKDIPFSILDLAPILKDSTAAQAFRNTLDLARHAEKWGYKRYWLAEHHSMPGIASAATAVVIGYVAGGTSTIRVGAGGVMLPNHAPLVIAEQFGTLESLYPGRIDLGLGRAPGTDQQTARALRRELGNSDDQFPARCAGASALFSNRRSRSSGARGAGRGTQCSDLAAGVESLQRATRGVAGSAVCLRQPLCAGRSDGGAGAVSRQISGRRKHCVALMRWPASASLPPTPTARPNALFTSLQQQFVNLRRGIPGPLNPPLESTEGLWTDQERHGVEHAQRESIIGSPEKVQAGIAAFIKKTGVDELMVTGHIFDHTARLRSFEIVAQVAMSRTPVVNAKSKN
jgi:alkanesulfonate monooxygenase SsuD/methylene tetrahydromethanopterin reductase-like flavin-dependent oxidoreductase (luciferase family)